MFQSLALGLGLGEPHGQSWRFKKVSMETSNALRWQIPVGLTTMGLFASDAALWYRVFLEVFAILIIGIVGGGAIFQIISAMVGTKIQAKKAFSYATMRQECMETVIVMYINATFATWPVYMTRMGYPIAVVHDVRDAVPFARDLNLRWSTAFAIYLVKFVFLVLFSDCWTYWKHRSLHSRVLWVFHKSHHVYGDPTCFAGFALHPFEAVWTFVPILAFCVPAFGVYSYLHWPMLLFFTTLNLYLHCGYNIEVLETYLPMLWINTSVKHNRHHEKTVNHYGEMLYLWDYICQTVPKDSPASTSFAKKKSTL